MKLNRIKRNSFEMKAHDIQFRKPRASYSHTSETYQGNASKPDWFLYGTVAFIISFGLIILWTLKN